jgi:hypothetical protein
MPARSAIQLKPVRPNGGKPGQHQGRKPGFRAKPVSVEAHKQCGPAWRQTKGKLATCMRHPESHAATIDFFPSVEAAAIGRWNIK